jgi:hypothetical protein
MANPTTQYAISASKGFSYYLPKPAQQHLQSLLKQLPSPARPIYTEYYRDLMCAKACAADSAAAMASFVTESFPEVAGTHNEFAKEMNGEMEKHEHEGYAPVLFPVVEVRRSGSRDGGEEVASSVAAEPLVSSDLDPRLDTNSPLSSVPSSPLLDSGDHSAQELGDLRATQVTKPTASNPTTPTPTPLPENMSDLLNSPNAETSHYTVNTPEATDHHTMVPSVAHAPSANTPDPTTHDNVIPAPAHAPSAETSRNVHAENQDIDMQEPATAAAEKDEDVDMLLSEEQGWEEGRAAIEGFSWK